ncbi:MAG: glycosyltransferase [Chloroflexota bacterium]
MKPADISIVIVNYNVKDFLQQCLKSIRTASQGLTVETIVVDNNSQDGSVEALQPLFNEVKFIALQDNLGFSKANNIGINVSTGKYILILNPDTILEEKTLKSMKSYMDANSEVGIAGCKVLNPDGSFQLACRRGLPTPWASFTRLFGLQKLFPKSKIFAQYNQTFRSVDETYYIDAVIGAFMFCRREAVLKAGGFDPIYFMYGDDLDLCYSVQRAGYKVAYYHETSIIHFKGESTRRSSINEIKHFYEAMEIFAGKYFGGSKVFLAFLRMGITVRTLMAYASRFRRDIFLIATDALALNAAMIIGSRVKFGEFFGFPEYAYPWAPLIVTIVVLLSIFSVGGYFERQSSLRRAGIGLLAAFFVLSSLTYYFREWAFSRGVLLFTIGATMGFAVLTRTALALYDKFIGRERDRRIAFIGANPHTESIARELREKNLKNLVLAGVVSTSSEQDGAPDLPTLGSIDFLQKIIERHRLKEIIITDSEMTRAELMRILTQSASSGVKFHIAQEYDELVASQIINEISPGLTAQKFNLANIRYRAIKRAIDIIAAILCLTLGLPFILLFSSNRAASLKKFAQLLKGRKTMVGVMPVNGEKTVGKPGLISLAAISRGQNLAPEAVRRLNEYYLENFDFSLDADILVKYISRSIYKN